MVEAVIPTDLPNTGRRFDCSVFDGKYITDDVDDAYFAQLVEARSDGAKRQAEGTSELVDVGAV